MMLALLLLPAVLASSDAHHTDHWRTYGAGVPPLNQEVLLAVDRVQASAPNGGGYFASVKATPPESPIGYPVKLFGRSLIDPPRATSYCSGSSYAVLIEALNRILSSRSKELSDARYEAMRMQEIDGGRREDKVRAWGWWNADGPGCHYALVQYLGIGKRVPIKSALPGDFMNISWTHGGGHSVVYLGPAVAEDGSRAIRFWSSQTGTNGLGDLVASWKRIQGVVTVRLTSPERLFGFEPGAQVEPKVEYDLP